MKDIYRQAEHFKNNHKESKVENIVIQAGKNHIHRESPRDTEVKSDFHDTVICFLGILPKRGSVVFDSINYMYIYIYIYIYISWRYDREGDTSLFSFSDFYLVMLIFYIYINDFLMV